jgi:hypothetical protein
MAALPPYIPARDGPFSSWLANFSTKLTAAPSTYGLVALDAVNVAAAQSAWAAAYLAATTPATRTPPAVQLKNVMRINALGVVRPLAQQISLNAGVLTSDKVSIGVNPRTSVSSPVTAPVTSPVLIFQSSQNLSAYVRYRDSSASPSVKAKPYGVLQVQIFGLVSATPVVDPTVMLLRASATKSPVVLTFTAGEVGKTCYLAARYLVRSGGVSPWSPILSFTVCGSA